METATAQSRKQSPDCVTTIYGNGKYQILRQRLMAQALKNNQEPSFTRLWKWHLLRLNQSSLKPKAPITIGVELSGLKGKIASALEKNEKLAPIAIGVEVRSQLETEGADRDRCRGSIVT